MVSGSRRSLSELQAPKTAVTAVTFTSSGRWATVGRPRRATVLSYYMAGSRFNLPFQFVLPPIRWMS